MEFMVCGFGEKEEEQYLPMIEKLGVGLELQSYGLVGSKSPSAWQYRIERHREICRRFEGKLAIHGPFLGISYNYEDYLLKAAVRQRLDMTLDVVREFRPQTLVLHSAFPEESVRFNYLDQWMKENAAFWSQEAEKYAAIGTTVVLENVMEIAPEFQIELHDRINHPNVKICMDVGHVNLSSKIKPAQWVKALGKRLRHIHLHDNHGTRDEHLPIGKGLIDFDSLFESLRQFNPDVTVSLEINAPGPAVAESLEYVLQHYR